MTISKEILDLTESSLEKDVRMAIANSGVGDQVEKDRYDTELAHVWVKSGHYADVLSDAFVDAGLKVEKKSEAGLTYFIVWQE